MWIPSKNFSDWRGCIWCIRYQGRGNCEAYPTGIPIPIVSGVSDHLVRRPGDTGILYAKADMIGDVVTGASSSTTKKK